MDAITTPFGSITREEVVATKYVVGDSVFATEEAVWESERKGAGKLSYGK